MKHLMKCFAKIVNGWIQSTILSERSILDVSLGSECVSDYPEAFSNVINQRVHFESFMNISNLINISLKYLSKVFPLGTIKLSLKPVFEIFERFSLSCYGFFIDNLEHVHNWVGFFC